MIDNGEFSKASSALQGGNQCSAHDVELLELKLAVAENKLDPNRALQAVLGILRQEPDQVIALELYREFSLLQYQAGRSCLSHSHPPPAL